MYQNVLKLYKPVGKTPLEMIRLLQRYFREYEHSTLGYAGRLDPMAEGLLIILVDDENKKRKLYERFEKKYLFEILFGVTTDTYDPLGIVQSFYEITSDINSQIQKCATLIPGLHDQPYPPYSSARVKGKPLFYWARTGMISTIEIPTKTIEVKHFEIEAIRKESFSKIYNSMLTNIHLVRGDFRQDEILHKWKEIYRNHEEIDCVVARCTAICSSGTYIRSLAHEIGQNTGTGAIALSIKRTQIGPFHLKDALKLI